jgi:hypothetical protein
MRGAEGAYAVSADAVRYLLGDTIGWYACGYGCEELWDVDGAAKRVG